MVAPDKVSNKCRYKVGVPNKLEYFTHSNSIFQAKVVDSLSGQLLPLGQPGELLIRGYCVMQGYWDEPDRTQESISEDGWYKTGWDFAYVRSALFMPLGIVAWSTLGREQEFMHSKRICILLFCPVTSPASINMATVVSRDAWRMLLTVVGKRSSLLRLNSFYTNIRKWKMFK